MYDIIGDIHGDAAALEALLQALGYTQTDGCYRHATRKAIFLGDFINKGNRVEQVLSIVKDMTDQQVAYAVPGNHEFYLLGYFTNNKEGHYIRPHTPENTRQHQTTLLAFQDKQEELAMYLQWLKTLPLFLESDNLRVVHAFWHQESIQFLKAHYPECCLSDRLLHQMVPQHSQEWKAVSELLIGHKLTLPREAGGQPFKTKWWNIGKSNRYSVLAVRPEADKAALQIQVSKQEEAAYRYAETEKPLFFGHYNLPGLPYLTGINYCCLDFGLAERKIITAYRWQGEQLLRPEQLIC